MSKTASIKPNNEQPLTSPSYVVALGASAGGTEAIVSFFEKMPSDSGLAFIVTQHLSPDFKSLMPDILKNATEMLIHTAEEGMSIIRNNIYLIPPRTNATLKEGHFNLTDLTNKLRINYPIDVLFESVAVNYRENAIAVVLSGAGTDGSRGIIKIAENGGLVLAQTPDDAQFTSMPQSAIATDVVTAVKAAHLLPGVIMQYIADPDSLKTTPIDNTLDFDSEHEQIFNLLFKKYKVDFNHYKMTTVCRRIDRRMQALNLHNLQEYLAYLQSNHQELYLLHKDLLIGVTLFFRDPEAFQILQTKIIPLLFEKQQGTGDDIRVWCPACSTGEEAYSIAILLFEYAEKNNLPLNVKIYATDVSTDFLTIASTGIYTGETVQYVSQKRLQRYFIKQDNQYTIAKSIRNMVIFAPHNLLASPPFIKMDLISCRNFLIYVQPLMQQKVLSLLHLGLNTNGFLFLGPSETIGELSPYVEPVSANWKIYKKIRPLPPQYLFNHNGGPVFISSTLMNHSIERPTTPRITSETLPQPMSSALPIYAYHALIKDFIPCGFIINESYNILHVFGRAGEFIFHQEGIAKLDILSMIANPLKAPLNAALYKAKKNKKNQTYTDIEIVNSKGDAERVKLCVKPIINNNSIPYYCICIEPSSAVQPKDITEYFKPDTGSQTMIQALEDKLQQTSEYLQNTIEELEITNEELLASNEELQSTNEELQSVNEVLYTANIEHQKKIIELRDVHTSIDNLLRSTEVGAIFVDQSLKIRLFTPVIARFFDLVKNDTGRSIKSFIFRANFKELIKKIEWVIKNNKAFEKEIKDEQGQWHLLRIFPYLKNDQELDGAIITLINVNEIKLSQIKLEETDDKLNLALKSSHIGIWQLDLEKNTIEHDINISEIFGLDRKKITQYEQLEELIYIDDRENVKRILERARQTNRYNFVMEFRILWPDNSLHYIASRGQIYPDKMGKNRYWTGACWDITNQIHLQEHLTSNQYRQIALDDISDGWWEWDLATNACYISPRLKEILGYQDQDISNDINGLKALIYQNDRKLAVTNISKISSSGKDTTNLQEVRFKHKCGDLIWILCRSKPVKDAKNKLIGIIGTHTNISELKKSEDKWYLMAHYDLLTQLPNRSNFINLITTTINEVSRKNGQFALFYIDIDNFKWINDKHGHTIGDAFLRAVANKFKTLTRGFDVAARIGGDEFAIMIKDTHSAKEVEEIAARYIHAFSTPFCIEGHEISTSLSIGIALFPQCGKTPYELLHHADAAMYQVKQTGKNSFYFFDQEISYKLSRHHNIDNQLLHAIDKNEFSLVYQPQFNLETGQLLGVETLVRWTNETLGNMLPNEFIPIAEETRLIVPIGNWIFAQAIKEYELISQAAKTNSFSLALNVSIVQLADPDFELTVRQLLKNSSISPENIIFEVSETAVMKQPEISLKLLHHFATLGIRFSLDDFGTGYSSLHHIKNLPIYSLKIGRSFVNDFMIGPNDGSTVKAIIFLAKNLGLSSSAAGIETSEQYTFLKETSCNEGQGYYLSKPLPLKNLIDFISNHQST